MRAIDSFGLLCPVAICLVATVASADAPNVDGLVTPEQEQRIAAQDAIILLRSGLVIDDAKFDSVIRDRRTNNVKLIAYKQGKRTSRKPIDQIYGMRIGGDLYRPRYHRPTQSLLLVNASDAQRQAQARINDSSRVFRSPQTKAEIDEAVKDNSDIFNRALKQFPNRGLHVTEGNQVIVLSDFPKPVVMQLTARLDRMCEAMNELFGLPKGSNCWRGKALIVTVSNRELFVDFERDIMENPNAGLASGIHHASPRRFLASNWRKAPSPDMARGIGWGLSSGYLYRYRSNFPLPPWLHTGTHAWVTEVIFPDPKKVANQQKEVQQKMKRTGSLLGLLSATELSSKRVVDSKMLVAYLVDVDKLAFRQLLEDCKLGVQWEEALKNNYGLDAKQVAAGFGRSIGVPNLTP
ncbi:MAG: hypothetical protein AAFU85_16490 [Planctomycetota bacterium]